MTAVRRQLTRCEFLRCFGYLLQRVATFLGLHRVDRGTGDGAFRRQSAPKPLNMSRGRRRGANTAAPPINNPGMSAASTIAAPATTAPKFATVPTTPAPKTELGNEPFARMKDVVKEVSPSSPSDDTSGARVQPSGDGGMTARTC